jgi:hypothetical protein
MQNLASNHQPPTAHYSLPTYMKSPPQTVGFPGDSGRRDTHTARSPSTCTSGRPEGLVWGVPVAMPGAAFPSLLSIFGILFCS